MLKFEFYLKLVFIHIILTVNLFSQNNNIAFERIGIKQGLPVRYMSSILQDNYGFIWINTLDGIILYDGYQFHILNNDITNQNSLPSSTGRPNQYSLYENNDSTIWICTGRGLSRYNRNTEDFTNYFPDEVDYLNSKNEISHVIGSGNRLWLDVPEGLYVFDTNLSVFKEYWKNIHDNSKGIYYKDSKIIFVDKAGLFWVVSGEDSNFAISRYDQQKDCFVHFLPDEANDFSFSNTNVNSIISDKNDGIWLATNGDGLLKIVDKELGKFEHYPYFEGDTLFVVFEDKKGNIWTGGVNSFSKYDQSKKIISSHRLSTKLSHNNSINVVGIVEDSKGNLWLGSNDGVYVFNPITEKLFHYKNDPNDAASLSGNMIQQLLVDNNDQIWILTKNNGISKYNPYSNMFNKRKKINYSINTHNLSNNQITGFLVDNNGFLWIGTQENGLKKTQMNKEYKFKNFYQGRFGRNLKEETITALYEDKNNNLWIGSLGGLYKYNPEMENFIRFQHDPENIRSISHSSVESIFEDSEGIFWVGTRDGLNIMNRTTGEFLRLKENSYDPSSISGKQIRAIYEDKNLNLWIAGDGYLNKFVRTDTSFIVYKQDIGNTSDLVSNDILCIAEDNSNNLWLGGYYLTSMNIDDESFHIYSENDGLPTNIIKGMILDDHNNFWVSTGSGLSKFNTKTKTFRNFDLDDGLSDLEFSDKSYYKDENGWMYFGSLNGFNIFHPDSIKLNDKVPSLYITGFYLFGKRQFFDHEINKLDNIILNHDETDFSFDFISLNLINPSENKYAYMLDGYDKDWIYCDTRNFAKYTNIPSGDYTFRVIGCNNDGYWNEKGANVEVIIKPPMWRSSWAYLIYVIIIGVALMENRRYRSKKREQKLEAQNIIIAEQKRSEVALAEAKAIVESASKSKYDFLVRMSHEIRIPLNTIIEMSHLALQTELSDQQRDYLIKVQSSSNSLLGVINDILDFSKIEAGKLNMESVEFDLEDVIDNLRNMISIKVEDKKLEFLFEIDNDVPRFLIGDPLRIGQVLINLVNNAVKFTEQGEIVVSVAKIHEEKNNTTLQFSIRDTGIGLTKEQINKLSKSFSQADDSTTRKYSGKGLAICKRLVELMHGDIRVESVPGKGSTFIFTIRFGLTPQLQKKQLLPEIDLSEKRALVVDDNSTS